VNRLPACQRVLMTADTIGGIFRFALELAHGLSRRGIEVGLSTMGPPLERAQRSELARVPGLTLFESRYALEWMDNPWRDVDAAGEWLLDIAERFAPDLVHLNGYCHAALAWRRPVIVTAHSCVLTFWDAVFKGPAPERYAEYRRRVTRGLQAAQAVTAPTRAFLAALGRHYGALPHARVIANGAEAARWPALDKQPYYLSAGRFQDPGKNLALLARTAPRLPWPVRVAGDLPDGASLPEGLEPLGRLSQQDFSGALGRAAVFVHPAHYEPFGLAPLEAACAGAALLLSDIESLREVWGAAALYFAPDDDEALLAAARFLARSQRLRDKFAEFARRRASNYAAADSVGAYASLYAEVLRRAPERGGAIERHA
jgi:glycogen(starch) synthase